VHIVGELSSWLDEPPGHNIGSSSHSGSTKSVPMGIRPPIPQLFSAFSTNYSFPASNLIIVIIIIRFVERHTLQSLRCLA